MFLFPETYKKYWSENDDPKILKNIEKWFKLKAYSFYVGCFICFLMIISSFFINYHNLNHKIFINAILSITSLIAISFFVYAGSKYSFFRMSRANRDSNGNAL